MMHWPAIVAAIPYIQFLNVSFERRGDELTAVMAYRDTLIGNPALPALHGGAIAAFLEVAAVIELTWATAWAAIEDGTLTPEAITSGHQFALPKTIDFTVDYLRSGLPAGCLCARDDQSIRASICIRPCRGMAGQS
jgi:acyl-coenzyme A thioesterase PaaI-like protein